jgi:hypothetical protein
MVSVRGRTSLIASVVVLLGLGVAGVVMLAGDKPAPAPAPAVLAPAQPATAVPGAKVVGEKPHWSDLKPAQQQALAPLQASWEELGPVRKLKWLEIGNRLATMKADEKLRVQERMREWVALSPAERKVVRENYARAQKITPPGQKAAQWEQYQQLPDEDKRKLAEAAAAKKTQVAKPPTPAQAQAQVKTPAPIKPHGQGLIPGPGTVPPGTVSVPMTAAATPSASAAAAASSPAAATGEPAPNAANVAPVPPAASTTVPPNASK